MICFIGIDLKESLDACIMQTLHQGSLEMVQVQRQDEHDVGTGSERQRRPPVSLNIKTLIQNILPETARNKSLADIFKVYRLIS